MIIGRRRVIMRRSVLVCFLSTVALLSKCSAGRLDNSYYDAKNSLNAVQISTLNNQAKLYNVQTKRQVLNENYGELNSGVDDIVIENLGGTHTKEEDDTIDKKKDVGIQREGRNGINNKTGEDDSLELSDVINFLQGEGIQIVAGGGLGPNVITAEGALRGVRITYTDVSYDAFIGIPYAEKPVRFQAAKPHPGWSGTRNATTHPDVCIQVEPHLNYLMGSEDCLYLNVATPSIEATGLPVLFAIHGGSFKFLSGNAYVYDPQMLMVKRNMIVVSFNYRLGALGFISTRTSDAPGNVGMKDIIQALRWVQRNIHKFGGDPNKVTLYGVSSGAAAIEFITLSKMAINLFSSIVIQSGSALNYINYQSKPLHYAFKLGKKLGEETTNVKKLIEHLRNAAAGEIMRIAHDMDLKEYPVEGPLIFVPSNEDPLPGEETFLADHPYSIIKSGDYIKVPSMVGFNDLEGAISTTNIFKDPEYLNNIDPMFEHLLPNDLMESIYSRREKNEIIQNVRDIYFNGQRISNETIRGFVDLMGDQIFVNGMFRSIDIRLRNSDAPIYYWQFAIPGDDHLYSDLGLEGAKHADDICYLFKMPLTPGNQQSTGFAKTSERLIAMVSNFMIYGNPTPNITSLLPVKWYPIQNKETLDYLEFNYDMKMKQDPYRNRRLLWEYIYSRRYGVIE